MTRPLDGIALQTYFRRLNLPKEAQDQLLVGNLSNNLHKNETGDII